MPKNRRSNIVMIETQNIFALEDADTALILSHCARKCNTERNVRKGKG